MSRNLLYEISSITIFVVILLSTYPLSPTILSCTFPSQQDFSFFQNLEFSRSNNMYIGVSGYLDLKFHNLHIFDRFCGFLIQKGTHCEILHLNNRRLMRLKVHVIKKSLVLMGETL